MCLHVVHSGSVRTVVDTHVAYGLSSDQAIFAVESALVKGNWSALGSGDVKKPLAMLMGKRGSQKE